MGSAKARQDIRSIVQYIGQHNPLAAGWMVDIIIESIQALTTFPHLYRRSDRIPGCREIVAHRNYVVVYRMEEECIRVVRVLHSSRMYF